MRHKVSLAFSRHRCETGYLERAQALGFEHLADIGLKRAVGPHDRVLEKPYQLEELARTIRTMIAARAARVA